MALHTQVNQTEVRDGDRDDADRDPPGARQAGSLAQRRWLRVQPGPDHAIVTRWRTATPRNICSAAPSGASANAVYSSPLHRVVRRQLRVGCESKPGVGEDCRRSSKRGTASGVFCARSRVRSGSPRGTAAALTMFQRKGRSPSQCSNGVALPGICLAQSLAPRVGRVERAHHAHKAGHA